MQTRYSISTKTHTFQIQRSYIIFICPFDEFKLGLHKYTFQNRCNEQPELVLGDESTKIFLCAGGDANDVSDDMKEFLEWLTTGKTGQCELVNNLDLAIQKARDHEEWRLEYMTLLMRDQEMMKKGREEGRNQTIFSYVHKGRITIEEGVKSLLNHQYFTPYFIRYFVWITTLSNTESICIRFEHIYIYASASPAESSCKSYRAHNARSLFRPLPLSSHITPSLRPN